MKLNYLFALLLSSALFLVSLAAYAQSTPQAPLTLKGRWETTQRSNDWTLQINTLDEAGNFKGRLLLNGVQCSTRGTDVDGTWSGGTLSFKVNISVKCGEWAVQLRDGNTHLLEGVILGTVADVPPKAWLDR